VLFLAGRHLVVGEDGVDRAGGLAGAAVDAGVGIDVEVLHAGEARVVLLGVDAVHRADVNAARVLRADAFLRDDARHVLAPAGHGTGGSFLTIDGRGGETGRQAAGASP